MISVVLLSALGLGACFNRGPAGDANANAPVAVEVPASSVDLTKPLVLSQKPEDVALAKKLDELIDRSEFSNARWGVFVVSLKDGRVLAARDAQKLFNPASVQKTITSVVALDRLGPDFRWQTRVFAKEKIENGTLAGDLVLYGGGAPDLTDANLDALVDQLKTKGLQRVRGNVVGDESFFTGDAIGDGWAWNEIQWYYGAAASALSINKNLVTVTLENGRPKIDPPTDYVQASGTVAAEPAGAPEAIGLKRGLGDNKIYVWGEGRNLDVRVAVENPALWSAKIFREALAKKGIAVEGDARFADWKSDDRLDPETASELARVESAPLGEIVRRMNKDSVNLYAELILRTLGRKFGAEAPDENPKVQKTRGDDAAGAAVIRKWLGENGASLQETETLHDGSGLSRLNFVTPETLGRTLIAGSRIRAAEIFKDSLPVAGADGTLRGRLGGAGGRIVAKTGSIAYVNALAGYAKRPDETLAFVIVVNNETRKADSTPLVDALAAALLGN
ncbi:MAG: D-alanyl-D-alanine carboxypeptidase/D-alanyl-D-alanine-endopeptidase [Acidobacteria bacterium]|nr:D-alanyl-D-alanine carboxypeptidase/D-alanyl-D-alanine-endopeptidase [Acidobacteriota bacterium]